MLRNLRQLFVQTNRKELLTDIISSASLGLVGDVICQLAVEKKRLVLDLEALGFGQAQFNRTSKDDFDVRRVAALTVFGATYVGGFLHYLYRSYSIIVVAAAKTLPFPTNIAKQLAAQSSTGHLMAKTACDNAHCGLIYTPAFFIAVGVMQGETFAEANDNLNREWAFTYALVTAFWVPYMTMNFKFFPPAKQVQVMATGNLVWNVIIDYIAHRGAEVEGVSTEPVHQTEHQHQQHHQQQQQQRQWPPETE
jgi:protein Mpv17